MIKLHGTEGVSFDSKDGGKIHVKRVSFDTKGDVKKMFGRGGEGENLTAFLESSHMLL